MKQEIEQETTEKTLVDHYNTRSQEVRSSLFGPFLNFLTRLGVGAQTVTNIRLILGIAAFLWFRTNPLWASVLFLAVLILDLFDGALARAQNTASDRGKFFDIAVDQVVYVLIILSLLSLGFPPFAISYNIFVIGAVYVLAIIKKQEGQPTDWIIKPRPKLSYLKAIVVIPFFLFTFFSIDIIPQAILLANVLATVLSIYYYISIQVRWWGAPVKKDD